MLIMLFLQGLVIASADVTQRELKSIKGVPVERFVLYQPSGLNFKCLDGSRTILYSQLNDDYCDCPDGSDEPGTSACQNGHFFCQNVGHRGNFIPSSRVNDKLCDCCDGSDEYDSGISCPNICDELGRAARIEKERKVAIARKGYDKRQELAKEGQQLRDETIQKLEPLREEKTALTPQYEALEKVMNDANALETSLKDAFKKQFEDAQKIVRKDKAQTLFNEIDVNKDGKITLDEITILPYVDRNFDGTVSEDEAKEYLINIESADFEYFETNIYSLLKDAKKNHNVDKQLKEEQAQADEKDDLDADEESDDISTSDHNLDEDDDEKQPPFTEEINNAVEASNKARNEFYEFKRKVTDLEQKIKDAEELSKIDYGEDFAWAALNGKCFERNVQQYTYKFCPFATNSQNEYGSGGPSLGSFNSWNGPENSKYTSQRYDNGQQCWNGPKRSTDVAIECGEEHELVEVTEPSKCEYHFVFRTPLACPDPETIHDEL
ncbi:unnamed protein product [Caenorhabditis angaria]|uniref:Glucosidase 2 subunit beta n=1 Tax=Caenorhabditis angaria TaxID=860376 RepID=A0A9P1IBI9_9PELO|nr:unnamed protein product [Caenorhabditis angaria]